MTLDKLSKGESAIITAIHANRELKNRFNSFGLVKGARISVEERSLGKKPSACVLTRPELPCDRQKQRRLRLKHE